MKKIIIFIGIFLIVGLIGYRLRESHQPTRLTSSTEKMWLQELFVKNCYAGLKDRGLVGYWPLEDNANDASGYGANGVITGASVGTLSVFGGSRYFDGVDDFIDCGNGTHTTGIRTNLTVSIWAYYNNVNGETGGVENYALTPVEGWGWILELVNGTPRFYVKNTSGTSTNASGGSVPLNTWSHIVGIYNGTNVKVFLNGVQTGTGTLSGLINNPDNLHIYFGKYSTFNGYLDDVRIYNRALSDAEMKRIYMGMHAF